MKKGKKLIFIGFIAIVTLFTSSIQKTTRAFQQQELHKRKLTFVFDCGDVLIKQGSAGQILYNSVPFFDLFSYFVLRGGSPQRLKMVIFTLLSQIPASESYAYEMYHDMAQIPPIIFDWQTGKIELPALIEAVYTRINLPENDQLFIHNTEKILALKIITEIIFNAKGLARISYPIGQGVSLVRRLKKAGYRVMMLSNWDSDSFSCMRQAGHTQAVFSYFDPHDIMISGDCGMCKPNPKFFKLFLDTYNLKAEDCFFIDDNKQNVQAAISVGMQAHWLENGDYAALEKRLKNIL